MKVLIEEVNVVSNLYKGNLKYHIEIKNNKDLINFIEKVNSNLIRII